MSVDAMLFGTGVGGESPSVIGRWAVIKLKYFDRRAGSWTASIFLTCGLVMMAAVSFALGLTLDVTKVGLVRLLIVGS